MARRPAPQDVAYGLAREAIENGEDEQLKTILRIHDYVFEDSDFRHPPCNIRARRATLVEFVKTGYDAEIAQNSWYKMLIPEKREEFGV